MLINILYMKKRNLKFIIGVVFLILYSCDNSKSYLESLLISSKWVYSNNEIKEGDKFITYLKFYDNGRCENFYITSNNPYIMVEDDLEQQSWSYSKEDNSLIIFGNVFKVLSYDENEIQLLKKKDNLKVFLLKITDKNYDYDYGMKVN